ncbi:hypothetical protein [Kitasatospora terrestris]|uniref:SnoaL-like domain-containing protein n=1 Tax=Kitasatospora terrestris TaxID=258051 RepID=A0ABP9DDD9_9ACTN
MSVRPVAFALAAVLAAAGCTTAQPAPPGPTVPDHSGQSLWHVIDADGKTIRQLPDDDPVVTAVRKTVVLHSGAVDNRDAAGIADSTTQEFTFYGTDFTASLRAQQYDTKLAALFTTNHLATRQVSIAWYQSTFPKDMTTAKVQMDATIEFTAADPGYLATSHLELNKPYTQHRSVSLAKQGDRWAIVAIDKNPLEAQNPPVPTAGPKAKP